MVLYVNGDFFMLIKVKKIISFFFPQAGFGPDKPELRLSEVRISEILLYLDIFSYSLTKALALVYYHTQFFFFRILKAVVDIFDTNFLQDKLSRQIGQTRLLRSLEKTMCQQLGPCLE